MELTHRNTDLKVLVQALNEQRTRALDVVAPAADLTAEMANIIVPGTVGEITESGVTTASGTFTPTNLAEQHLATRLDIPVRYLRKLRNDAPTLWDTNVNEWMSRSDDRWMLRLLRGDDGFGVLRAALSDRYRTIDNFDVLLAMLEGMQDAGEDTAKITADLTDRRMIVRVTSQKVSAVAKDLLRGYRSPFTGQNGTDLPVVWAGWVGTNSEVGAGAFTLTPRVEVQICGNGMTIKKDAMREIHLGTTLPEGVIKWSARTVRANLEMVKTQTVDAVSTFMSQEYLDSAVRELTRDAGVKVAEPVQVIGEVSKRLGFSKDQADAILSRFIEGGLVTSGGVMQAVTAAAQDQADGEEAFDMESKATDAMVMAASLAK